MTDNKKSALKVILLSALLLLFLPLSSSAQNHTVKGTVVDSKSKDPLPYVNVGLFRISDTLFMRGATTDLKGNFVIPDVKKETYFVRISLVGYQEYFQKVTINGNTDLGSLSLKSGTTLQAVEVSASKPMYSMDGEKNIYNTGDDPSIQTGTASDALQNAPGIEIDADGNITLRGTQSVEIWINDRPSHMDGEALKQYIKMLPANSIQKIEVISNPSARYGGGTPVVNIVTNQKVQRNEFFSMGFNGSSRPDQGIWLSEMKPWMSYVFANEKFNFNIYANFGYNNRESEYTGSQIMLAPNGDTSRVTNYLSQSHTKNIESYIGGNFSYTISDKDNLGAWYGAYPRWGSDHQYGKSERFEYLEVPGSIINHTYEGTEDKPMIAKPNGGGYFGGWYQHMFDKETGRKLNVNLNANGWNSNDFNHHERRYSYLVGQNIVRDIEGHYGSFNASLGADYVYPFGTMDSLFHRMPNELDLGVEYSHANSRQWSYSTWEQMGFLTGKTDSIDKDQSGRTDALSAYITYQRRFGNFTAKVGLRGNIDNRSLEYFNRPQYSLDSTFFNLTPSIHLSYSTKSMHNFSFSYTRRINQPGLSDLTLYKEYDLDNYGEWGNPDLRPTYNQKVEVQWDKYFMKFGSVGAQFYYSRNTDEASTLADVIYSDFYGHVVNYSMPMNIGDSYNTGLDLNLTYRPTSFINIRFNGGVRYNNEDFTFRDEQYKTRNWSYKFRVNAWAKLWKNYQFFVNAHYGSPTKSIFTITDARKGVDVGVNADFFDRKMTVNLNVHDIFNINAWNTQNVNPFYSSTSNWKPMSRYITLGLTVRFGKMELSRMAKEGAESTEETYR